VTDEAALGAREAGDATRGSAIKLGAEVGSRLLGLATTLLLLRGLGASGFGVFSELQVYALLLAELGEMGLQALASRALVAGTLSLRALVRARLALAAVVTAAAGGALAVAPRVFEGPGSGPALSLLLAWFALSGWAEFLGVALRCRGARVSEALLLLLLRATALAFALAALLAGGGLLEVAVALALSPLPALLAGALALRRGTGAPRAPSPAPAAVLRESLPLAAHGALLLLGPRVEFLVLSWLLGSRVVDAAARDRDLGLFAAGLSVVWFLSMVPSAIAAGAMPALTREALRGEGPVRRRTAATLALLGAPAAVGLALVAPALVRALLGGGYPPEAYAAAAAPLRVMALALPALFLNGVLTASLIAAGRAAWLPALTAARVAAAFGLAFALVPPFGLTGAAAGLAGAETLLLLLLARAAAAARFPVPVALPIGLALGASVPMALAVGGIADRLLLAVALGALTWAATLAAWSRLAPGSLERLLGCPPPPRGGGGWRTS
jgi:O-antigen/teichoic acid export membrane protein